MLSLAFVTTLSSCSSSVAHLPFGMMSLAALTCHLGEDLGRLSNDNERGKTHHDLRNLNMTNKTNKLPSLYIDDPSLRLSICLFPKQNITSKEKKARIYRLLLVGREAPCLIKESELLVFQHAESRAPGW
jgi:hypothetical protein